MWMNLLRRWFEQGTKSRKPGQVRHTHRMVSFKPWAERLEDRIVPSSLLFSPQYGSQGTTNDGEVTAGSTPVYLIFAGGSSSGFGYGRSLDQTTITNAVKKLLASPYLGGLSEYGATTQAHVAATLVSNYPLAQQFTVGTFGQTSDITNLVNTSFFAHGVFIVITPPGYRMSDAPNDRGKHSDGVTTQGPVFNFKYEDAAVLSVPCTTGGQTLTALDSLTTILSHEFVESLTDPHGNGVGTIPPPNAPYYDGLERCPAWPACSIRRSAPAARYFAPTLLGLAAACIN